MRGHRLNLFSDRFKFVGIGVGNHKKFKYCCVVNFAVEYEEKDEEEEVYFDKLPDIGNNEPEEGEYYQDELDEMAEWKGPVGIPHFKGVANKQNLPVFKKHSNHIRPHQPMQNNAPFAFQKKKTELKSNAPLPRKGKTSVSPKPNKNKMHLKKNHSPHRGPHKAKCKVFSVPLGGLSDEEKISEEVVHLKRKNTIEDYSSEKELKVMGGLPPGKQQNEEVEEMLGMGMGMHFQKKKKQSNNMYMKQGVNRNQYIQDHTPKRGNWEAPKGKGNFPPKHNVMKKATPVKVNSKSPKPVRPYMIPKKSGGYNSSRSPNTKKNYNNYTSTQNGRKAQPQKKSSNSSNSLKDVDDKRSKQLLEMDDFSMPFEAMNCMTKRIVKIKGGNRIKTVRKIFTMRDGTQEIHENVYVERIEDKK